MKFILIITKKVSVLLLAAVMLLFILPGLSAFADNISLATPNPLYGEFAPGYATVSTEHRGELPEKSANYITKRKQGLEKETPTNLPQENFAKPEPISKQAEPYTAQSAQPAGLTMSQSPNKSKAPDEENQHVHIAPPTGMGGEAKTANAEVFSEPSLMDYTTITVPSTHLLTFDGSEDLSGMDCYGKGYRFWGNAGQFVQIHMDSTDIDSFLILYDANFNLLTWDDDGGGYPNALINYYLTKSAYYYIEATMYDNRLGSATLSIAFLNDFATLIFDANGGYLPPDPVYFAAGQWLEITTYLPTRLGYIFMGWSLSPTSASAQYQPADWVTFGESTTLYAVWQEYIPVTLPFSISGSINATDGLSRHVTKMHGYSFYAPAGSVIMATMESTEIDSYLYLINADWDVVAYNDDTYDDEYGWTLNSKIEYIIKTSGTYYLQATTFGMETGNYNLNISSTIRYALTYDANGGYWPPDLVYFEAGQWLQIDDYFPNKPGYIFMGWSLSPTSASAQYQPYDWVSFGESATLYAIWQEYTPVTLTFSINGSINATDGLSRRGTKMHGYAFYAPAGSAIMATMESNEVDAYLYLLNSDWDTVAHNDDFAWSSDSQLLYVAENSGTYYLQATTFDMETGDYDLSISFTTLHTLTYNTQGGSPLLTQQTIFAGATAYLSNTLPLRPGYTFMGWNTDPQGYGDYGDYYQRFWPVLMPSNDLALYAIWQPHQYQVYDIIVPSSQTGQLIESSPLLEDYRLSRYNAYRVWLT
ncbi:MAG: InlB B-repeat-containing protein, partial [Clostridiales bacterium]|nr:InlB B-repeat-containing protein [Clostridiales bacterium]